MVNAHFDRSDFEGLRLRAGLTQGEFASVLGITRELVNKIESGKSPISRRTRERLFQFQDQQNGQNGKNVNKSEKRIRTTDYLSERRKQKSTSEPFMVPLVGVKAQAGYMKGFEQSDYLDGLNKFALPPGVNPAGAVWRYFEIEGDSMEPTLSEGDVILATMVPVEDWNDIKDLSVYVIHTPDQLLVKRIVKTSGEQWLLISDNQEEYPPVTISPQTILQVWLFRRHIRSKLPPPENLRISA